LKNKRWIIWLIVAVLLGLLLVQLKHSSGFAWDKFWQHARYADPLHIALGLGIIYFCYTLRAVRWAILLRPTKKVSAASLLGTQFIGFTAIALFGRLGELVRPYLVARRTQLTLSSQLAVYAVERMFDLASVALIFSVTLALSPSLNTLPHHELFHKIGYVGLGLALAIAAFAWFLRATGGAIAAVAKRGLGWLSTGLGESISAKILAFRDGLQAISSLRDLVDAMAVSLVMWAMIAWSYIAITHSFTGDPILATLPFSHCMLLMAASMVGSMVQLPFIGGGSQMATATAMRALFGVQIEAAVACGILLWLVSFAGVVPVGLIWARFEHVSLRKAAAESEEAETKPAVATEQDVSESAN
jgi:uncharacterized protein (TIRG00374 family)